MTISDGAWAAIIGALAGSASGGAITAGLQWLSMHATKRERDRATAYSLLFKMTQLHANLAGLNRRVESSIAMGVKSDEGKEIGHPWRHLQPLANVPTRIIFSAEEMALVLSLGADELVNDLALRDAKHNATLDLLVAYSEKRTELQEILEPVGEDGLYGTIDFSKVSIPNRLRMAGLNSMIESLTAYLPGDAIKAFVVLRQLAALFKTEFGTRFGVQAKAPAKASEQA
jgi:hypothetical protein